MGVLLLGSFLWAFNGVADTRVRGNFERKVDPFTGEVLIKTGNLCSGSITSDRCFQFLISSNGLAAFNIYYTDDDWGFFRDVRMKVLEEDGYIDLVVIDISSDVLHGGYVFESLTIIADEVFYRFAKGAVGKRVLVRLSGRRGYIDFVLDTSVGRVWDDFIRYYEEFVGG